MSKISRRTFLAGSAAAGAAAFAGRFGPAAQAAESAKKITRGTDLVTLGRSGVKSTVLGLGTGTHGGREQRALGPDGFAKLVHYAYERGIRYIDTADMYRMHGSVRHAIKGLPREELFIQTKTRAKEPAEVKADIERFRKELGVDYFDSLLIHAMTTKPWPTDMRPVMDALFEAKQKGIVRAVGVSCHGFDPLASSAVCDWCDVHLVRINPFEMKMDGPPGDVVAQVEKMHELGHGVIGMKIFGETGFKTAEKRMQSLKFALAPHRAQAFTIGFTSTQQIDETLGMIEKALA